jgi:hypothetical protein
LCQHGFVAVVRAISAVDWVHGVESMQNSFLI